MIGSALLLVAGSLLWLSYRGESHRETRGEARKVEAVQTAGTILGLTIGTSMAEAREKLDPLRVPADYEPDAKEESGRRIYWKLKETEYDWLMAWGNAAGKITRMRAVLRPGRARPFSEIGDLDSATSADATQARWNLRAPDGANYRLIA